jgi:hypothetical protein
MKRHDIERGVVSRRPRQIFGEGDEMEYKGITFEVRKRENHFALPRPRGQNPWTWEARVFGEVLTATLVATTQPEVIECVIRFIDNKGFSAEDLIDRQTLN